MRFYWRLFISGTSFLYFSLQALMACVHRFGDINICPEYCRRWAAFLLPFLRVHVDVRGREHIEAHHPCIYLVNHQSSLDVPLLGAAYPSSTIVIGKKELRWIPVFGFVFEGSGNILIDRQRRDRAIGGLAQAVAQMKEKHASVLIFPEGTRNARLDGLLPFKKGGFHMAIAAQVPIVPVVFSSLRPVLNWKRRRLGDGRIVMKFLPPVPTQGLRADDLEKLMVEVREIMHQEYVALSKGEGTPVRETLSSPL